MGVTSPRPTWLLGAGLLAVFAGWRIFDAVAVVRFPLLVLGTACLLVAAGWRLRAWRQADGEERSIAAIFAFGTLGCLVGLAGFVPTSDGGLELLNLDFDRITEQLRFQRFFLVAAPIVLGCSLLPVLGAQWAVGKGGRSEGAILVDALRARETSANALSLGLAGAALMLIGYVTAALDRTADFSYFKTSQPGEAVREIVLSLEEPLQAAFFFPAVNAVKDEAVDYFRKLARATDRVAVEEYDRFADIDAAAEYGARSDGSIFLRVEGRTEQIQLPLDLDEARDNLKGLDGRVQQALLLLVRQERYAYLTTGHGELNDLLGNDPKDDPVNRWLRDLREGRKTSGQPPPPLNALRELLAGVNYEARDFGIAQGLGDRIPDDAAMVMIIGPQTPFLDGELNSVREYLDRGGSLLVALEPDSDFRFEELRDDLGIDYDEAMTVDDDLYVQVRRTLADRRNIVTNRFSTHAAVTTANRHGVAEGVWMVGPGRLTPAEDVEDLRTNLIINSLPSSFQDRNGDFRFDEETEVRGSHGLAAAVEGVAGEGEEDDIERPGMRALVYADAEIFAEGVLLSRRMQWELVSDGIRWLGREEAFAGQVVSEVDVPIRHTQAEDVIWFYAIIFGGPALVLGAGLTILYGRRRHPNSASSS
jgi:hypothetical protein